MEGEEVIIKSKKSAKKPLKFIDSRPKNHPEVFNELGRATRFKPGPQQVKISKMGNEARKGHPNVILGAKLRMLKAGGFTDKTKERLFELYKNSNFSKLDMLDYLEKLRRETKDPKEKILIYNAIRDTHKLLHGTKEHDRKVAAVVLHLTTEERKAEIARLLTG